MLTPRLLHRRFVDPLNKQAGMYKTIIWTVKKMNSNNYFMLIDSYSSN